MTMLFSVIIPTYNRLEFLPGTLESVWRQTFSDYEVIVVDDGSTDGTAEYLASLGDRVRVLSQANGGPGAARNAGAAEARGQYLAFLDSDDLWFPWTLASLAQALAATDWPTLVSVAAHQFTDRRELDSVVQDAYSWKRFDDFLDAADQPGFDGSGASVVARGSFLEVGGFDTSMINCEDHDLFLRLGTAGAFVRLTAPAVLAYRRHARSLTADMSHTSRGVRRLMENESLNRYPGGPSRRRERQALLTRHVRPVALACLKEGLSRDAWRLYAATIAWHLASRRWKFLTGFPISAAMTTFSIGRWRTPPTKGHELSRKNHATESAL